MNVSEKVKDTKDNGLYVECKLLGDGSEENPYMPEIFNTYKGYYHLDTRDIDYTNKTVKVWVNKKKTTPAELTKLRNDNTITKIKETTAGAIVGET